MKRQLMTSGLVAALMAAPIGFASAADQKPTTGTAGPTAIPEQVAPQAAPQSKPKYEDFGARVPGGNQKGSSIDGKELSDGDLQDKTVYDLEDREVGTVKDVSAPFGENRRAIVEVGGFLGFGGKDVAVPVQHFQLKPDGRLIVKLTEKELKQMPPVHEEGSTAIKKKS
jgi:sporulation protein YlmC with PRC-barrel domain